MTSEFDIAIIGAGPSGLTAGIYAARAGKKVVIFEGEVLGGQAAYTDRIDNFPATPGISGMEYVMKIKEQAESFGAEVIMDKIKEIKKPEEEGGNFTINGEDETYGAKAVILATGLSTRKMALPNEENLIGKGISFCALCDGAFFRNREVAVYGGGNTALEDAVFLSNLASKVTIIHRRDRFRGEQALVSALEVKDNVVFAMNKTISAVHGEDVLTGVTVKDKLTGEETKIKAEGLFVAIGKLPNGKPFENLITLDSVGFYEADEDCTEDDNGVYVAGDGRSKKIRQLATAVGDGAVAASHACSFIDRLNNEEYI